MKQCNRGSCKGGMNFECACRAGTSNIEIHNNKKTNSTCNYGKENSTLKIVSKENKG